MNDQIRTTELLQSPESAAEGAADEAQTAFSRNRSGVRNKSTVPFSKGRLHVSLQNCSVENNLTKLQSSMKESRSVKFKKKCLALSTILETFFIPALYKTNGSANGKKSDVDRRVKRFMDSEDGLDILVDMAGINTIDVRDDDLETRFKDALLDKEYGLRCILFKHPSGQKFIVLDSDSFDMVAFLQEIIENDEQIRKQADKKLLPIFTDDLVKDAIQFSYVVNLPGQMHLHGDINR